MWIFLLYNASEAIKPCGGIVYENKGEIVNSVYSGRISVSYEEDTEIDNGIADGTVGGIAGYNSGKIYNCVSVANLNVVIGQGEEHIFKKEGGIVGSLNVTEGRNCMISNCYFIVNNIDEFDYESGRYFYCHNGSSKNPLALSAYFTSVDSSVIWADADVRDLSVYEALNSVVNKDSCYGMNRW